MARRHRSEVLVGAFILAAVGLFVLLVFLMGSLEPLLGENAVVEADFSEINSLQAGDPVYVFGVKAGKVLSTRLLPRSDSERATVRVAMRLPVEFRRRLRRDSPVKIDKTLTGSISVWIREGEGPDLGDGERLRGVPSADLSAVADRASELLGKAEGLVATISRLASEIEAQGSLSGSLADLRGLLKELRDEVGPLRVRVREILDETRATIEENRLDVRHTIANFRETSALAKTFAEKLEATPELLDRSLAEIEKAGAAVKDLLGENRSHIDAILEDLRKTSTNAANLTAEVKRRPWRLLYRPSAAEIRAMDLYDAAWAYNLGATELNRSVRDLADQMTRASREGLQLEALREAETQVRQSLRRYREAEETFWERLRAAE